MLAIATKIGRRRIFSQCSLTVNNKFEYSNLIVLRGYVEKYAVNIYVNKIQKSFCHATIVQHSSKSNLSNLSRQELDEIQYEKITSDTLESLTDYFDELIEKAEHLKEADVTYGDGVLTVKLGNEYGTYVINRQTPNKQIWLSSPISGPKRYDFINETWIYKHDGNSLHQLLDSEMTSIVKITTSFSKCAYSKKT